MATTLHPAEATANVIAGSAQRRLVRQSSATLFKLREITIRLFLAPVAECMYADIEKVVLGAARETKAHLL